MKGIFLQKATSIFARLPQISHHLMRFWSERSTFPFMWGCMLFLIKLTWPSWPGVNNLRTTTCKMVHSSTGHTNRRLPLTDNTPRESIGPVLQALAYQAMIHYPSPPKAIIQPDPRGGTALPVCTTRNGRFNFTKRMTWTNAEILREKADQSIHVKPGL